MKIPALRLSFPDEDIETVQEAVADILSSGNLTMGKYVETFEKEFKAVSQVKHAVAVSNGTAALEIILRAIDVRGWDVLLPTNTFIATAVAVDGAGGQKIFVDCNEDDLCVDMADIERKTTPRTKALILVHIGGIITSHLPDIENFCRSRGIFLVEDAAHAHGSQFQGRRAGGIGHAGAFSFFPTKVVTSGEGGMITTNDDELAYKARILRTFGREDHLNNVSSLEGDNWRFSELNAAVGLTHLRRLDENLRERVRIAGEYDELLKEIQWIRIIRPSKDSRSSYYKYSVFPQVSREKIKSGLAQHEIFCPGEVYRVPCHLQPVYHGRYRDSSCPKAEWACASHLCLPLYPHMTRNEVETVVENLRSAGETLTRNGVMNEE